MYTSILEYKYCHYINRQLYYIYIYLYIYIYKYNKYINIFWYGNSRLPGKPIQNWNAWMRCSTVPPENYIESTCLLNNTCVVHYMFLRCICNWLKMTAVGEVQIREWLKDTYEYHTLTRWDVYWHPLVSKKICSCHVIKI